MVSVGPIARRRPHPCRARAAARCAAGLALLAAAGATSAQQLRTYTESSATATTYALGYPPPIPVASLTPVQGFRDYASLHARHQALALASPDARGVVVGRTQQYGREIWAYVIGDEGRTTVDGEPEGTAFVNANIHAREWQAPEVSTGIYEYLIEHADDGGLVRYVLDNFELVLIPVLNVDGLLQTQRYPTQVIVGQDPTSPTDWPRDGRMRRKNMRGVDELLGTVGDHLGGIDLNRNYEPYWGPNSSGSSRGVANPNALTYYGTEAGSEAESGAVQAAIDLADPAALRLGIDLHSFGAVFFAGNAGLPGLSQWQQRLIERMQAANGALTRSARFPNGRYYAYAPDPPNAGLGSLAEYLARFYRVPAWTLELEPVGGGAEYGGLGTEHDGFILPEAEIARVRDGWAATHALAFYHQAGPPYLAAVEVRDAASGELRYAGERKRMPDGTRAWLVTRDVALVEASGYRATLRFSKPMRWRVDGAIAQFPGQTVTLDPLVTVGEGTGAVIRDGSGAWLDGDRRRYRDDSYAFNFNLAAGTSGSTRTLNVAATDLAGVALDARPETPVGFNAGFTGYENAAGIDSLSGGADATVRLRIASAAAPITATLARSAVFEGDDAVVSFERRAPGAAVTLRAEPLHGTTAAADFGDWPGTVSWAEGETGSRRLRLPTVADTVDEGEETAWIRVVGVSGTPDLVEAALPLTLSERIRVRERGRAAAGGGSRTSQWSGETETPGAEGSSGRPRRSTDAAAAHRP